jgi:fatty acid desaturase
MNIMDVLAYISVLGMGVAAIGAALLAELAYEDFKKRRKEREARRVRKGIIFLFVGFLLATGGYYLQIGWWQGLLLLVAFVSMGALGGFLGFRSRRS